MRLLSRSDTGQVALLLVLFASALSATVVSSAGFARADETKSLYPWTSAQTVQPGELATELAGKNLHAPTVVYVGFRTLFTGGHIPGATFHGSASTADGLAELKKWADTLPRSADLVIYCGCCPFEKCPSVRPAFTTLSGIGFKKLRVLLLPTNFATDWVDKGYPMQKGM